ncbi:MAG: NYN domain-containing protein [Oscillospiraceae bacterium]|nr:NYN domain-containing protein [Oscillospiraceae bacterium]
MENNLHNLRLAVLIDAENVPYSKLPDVIAECAVYGTPTLKRIYGDWTNNNVSGWKNLLLSNAITPIQQYSYTQGKNSSDSAMIIDAMDILYTERTDGFVLVSSDSDFTRLAIRLRESGQYVIGIGERKTPPAFIAACDKFTYIEVIRKTRNTEHKPEPTTALVSTAKTPATAPPAAANDRVTAVPRPVPRDQTESREPRDISAVTDTLDTSDAPARSDKSDKTEKRQKVPDEIVQLIADSVADLTDDDDEGGVFMGELGNLIRRKRPDFDFRNYGYSSISALIKSVDRFEIDFRQTSDPHIKHPYVKDKQA